MKVLFISRDLIAGNLAYLLSQEGHDVKLYIKEKSRRGNFTNLVNKTTNWRSELPWVGKEGLIIFDDVGWGKIPDLLRKKGYAVFGGSKIGEELETKREFGQKIFSEYGLRTMILRDFDTIADAIEFIKANPAAWVIKKNGNSTKFISYVGEFDDGSDVVDLLQSYTKHKKTQKLKVSLQKRIYGVEIGIARFFNGNTWVGPIEFNIEHVNFLAGDIGPSTSEMGTLAWYSDDTKNRLYQETLEKIEPFLRKIQYHGDFGLSCIVNEDGAYILEATSRLGSPIVHLQSEIHDSQWGNFLWSIARGENHNLQWKKGYGIVVAIAVPPFPYAEKMKEFNSFGMPIRFDAVSDEEMKHIHFEEVSCDSEHKNFYISDHSGYVLYVTGFGKTIAEAQHKANAVTKKIRIPKMLYRNDIGDRFVNESKAKLKTWGYI